MSKPSMWKRMHGRLWVWRFDLEERRQAHGLAGNYVRSAGCSFVLAALRLSGTR